MDSKPLTDAEIAELRKLHDGVIAQDTEWARRNGQQIYPENVAFMVACNNRLGPLLDEVTRARALLNRIEWGGEFDGCPCCGGWPVNPLFAWHKGHVPGCELAALIGKAQ